MIAEPLAEGHTFLHRAHPAAKLAGAGAFAACTAVVRDFPPLAAAAVVAALLLAASRPPLGVVLKRFAAVNIFILFLWLFLPFTTPGQEAARILGLTATSQGLRLAALITVKCNVIVAALMALISTSAAPDIGRGLRALKVPAKFCLLMVFAYRQIHVLASEHKRLMEAARLRGFRPGTSLRTYKTHAHLMAMVFLRADDKAEKMREAMELRCFDGVFRTLGTRRAEAVDALLAAGLFVASAIIIALEALA